MPKIPQGMQPYLATLRFIADAGFVAAFNIKARGAQIFFSEYDPAWVKEYDDNNYHVGDPILLWAVFNTGAKRWEDIRLPDTRGVLKKAKVYGLHHGVIISKIYGNQKSILSAAKSDVPFTDKEMAHVAETLDHLVENLTLDNGLTTIEIEALAALRDGMSYEEASGEIGVSVSAVKQRVEKARRKLGAANTVQAVAMAIENNLL